jgi:hypothetical protein
MFYRSLFVLLSLFFWQLFCLVFFDLRILVTPLVSLNFSLFKILYYILKIKPYKLIIKCPNTNDPQWSLAKHLLPSCPVRVCYENKISVIFYVFNTGFTLTPYCCLFSWEAANTNVILFWTHDLTCVTLETLTITPPMWVVLPQKKNNLGSNFNLDIQNRKNHTYQ